MSVGGVPESSLPSIAPSVGATANTEGLVARNWKGIRSVWPPSAREAVTYHSICVGFAGTDSPFTVTFTTKLVQPFTGTETSEIASPAALVKPTDTPSGMLRTALELN